MKGAKNLACALSVLMAGPIAAILGAAPLKAAEAVDVALVIATDVSYSVDESEARFQRGGAGVQNCPNFFRDPRSKKAGQPDPLCLDPQRFLPHPSDPMLLVAIFSVLVLLLCWVCYSGERDS